MHDNEKFKKFFGFGGDESTSVDGSQQDASADARSSKDLLDAAQKSVAEWTEKYISLSADFQNYKKRVDSERAEWSLDAQKKVFIGLLAIIDNFERALDAERKAEGAEKSQQLIGFEMIYQSLEKLMQGFGIKEITDFAEFNPKYHEALMQVESADHASGSIVQVLQKGYLLNEKVIRPATVSVAQ
jgi:molecular chaperone GrpE